MSIDSKIWDFLADRAVEFITKKESVSDLRGKYFDIMSEARWANPAFNKLIDNIYHSLDNIERMCAQRGDKDEDWMADGVARMVDGHFASSVLSDNRIADSLGQRDYDGMVAAFDEFKELTGQSRSRGRDSGYDRGRGSFGNAATDRGGREAPSRGRDLGVGRGSTPGRSSGSRSAGVGDSWDMLANIGDEPQPEQQRRTVEPESRYVPPVAQAVVEPIRNVRAQVTIDGPDYTKARPYDRFRRGDELWELAHLSKWKLTGDGVDIESTIPTLYNCNTHVKYFVQDLDGRVREELEPVNEDTRYAAHETLNRASDQPVAPKPASSGFSRATLQSGGDDDGLSKEHKPTPRQKLVDLIDDIKEDQLQLNAASPVDSLTGAIFSTRAKLRADNEHARVDLHLLRTPIVATSFEQIALIELVYNTNSLAGAQEKLNELKPQFDLPVWETLNTRFSDYLLRALRFQFQYNEIVKFNFSKHYGKLLEKFAADRGADAAASFAHRVGYITDLACGHFSKDDVAGYTEDLFEHKAFESEGVTVPVVSFVDFIALAAFDATLDQLGIGNQLDNSEMGVVVNATDHSELNRSLRKLYENLDRAVPTPAKIRAYLSTSDNRLVEVLPYANKTDVFILAAV